MPSSSAIIAIAGAGRVATRLGHRLQEQGIPVTQVISRTAAHARILADELSADWSDDWSDIRPDTTWLILAVSDDAIAPVAAALSPHAPGALATHTSGATPGAVLRPYFGRYGVFYPLQSFSTTHAPDWDAIPLCIDATNTGDTVFLTAMATAVGKMVYSVDDAQRAVLHAAAVFANNFANHCFTVAENIVTEAGLPFSLLHPLMQETVAKALREGPALAQTGPARRGDTTTIERHLALLAAYPDRSSLYAALSADILRTYK